MSITPASQRYPADKIITARGHPVSDDARITQQSRNVILGEGGDPPRIKSVEGSRKFSRLRRTVIQDNPDWNASRVIRT
jgi:hypothetical protein